MAAEQRTTVVGVFDRREQAERAVRDLEAAGFRDDQIGLAVRGSEDNTMAGRSVDAEGGNAGGGAATGAVVGGILGAIAALVIPGVGPVLAVGTLGTAIAGAVVGAGVGAIAGGLIGMGVPEEEAKYYQGEFEAGRTLVTVNAGSRFTEAQNILRTNGGYDVETRGQRAGVATPMAGTTTAPMASTAGHHHESGVTDRDNTMRLREEELVANKERVQTGEVEIGKRVVEEQRTIDVPVTREEVVVERRPVDRRPTDEPIHDDSRTIEVPISEERVDVDKQTVVTGEVDVSKRQVHDTHQVSGTVRREEPVINREGDVNVRSRGETDMGTATDWNSVMPMYRSRWEQRYGNQGGRWEDYEPSYRYGYEMYNDPRYRGRSWDEVQDDLRRDWDNRHPERPWDRAGDAVHDAWENVKSGVRR